MSFLFLCLPNTFCCFRAPHTNCIFRGPLLTLAMPVKLAKLLYQTPRPHSAKQVAALAYGTPRTHSAKRYATLADAD